MDTKPIDPAGRPPPAPRLGAGVQLARPTTLAVGGSFPRGVAERLARECGIAAVIDVRIEDQRPPRGARRSRPRLPAPADRGRLRRQPGDARRGRRASPARPPRRRQAPRPLPARHRPLGAGGALRARRPRPRADGGAAPRQGRPREDLARALPVRGLGRMDRPPRAAPPAAELRGLRRASPTATCADAA